MDGLCVAAGPRTRTCPGDEITRSGHTRARERVSLGPGRVGGMNRVSTSVGPCLRVWGGVTGAPGQGHGAPHRRFLRLREPAKRTCEATSQNDRCHGGAPRVLLWATVGEREVPGQLQPRTSAERLKARGAWLVLFVPFAFCE